MIQEHRYCLAENDLAIIKQHNGDKPLSENARKSLIILSEVFGGLHHIDSDQLEIFDYQSTIYNDYLFEGSMATFDGMVLTLLVIIAHDMAVRFEIQPARLDPDDEHDRKLLEKQLSDLNSDNDYNLTMEDFIENQRPYIRLLFHQRQRDGRFWQRHPTLEETIGAFRKNNKRYA